jgi:two-component system, OmpR family, response regulator
MRILMIEDEPELASAVTSALGKRNIVVDSVPCIEEAYFAISEWDYTVVLLDRSLPDGDGLTAIPRLRAAVPGIPIIVLTAAGEVAARIEGLEAGADDYLCKPFSMDELTARLRALARRHPILQSPTVTVGSLELDLHSLTVSVRGEMIDLRRRELLALQALVQNTGKTVRRRQLIAHVYGLGEDLCSNTLDAHISRLRGKLTQANAGVEIRAVRGIGYLLCTLE